MATYIISYDLNSPGQNYSDLYAKIKSYGGWWHHLDSTWLVVSNSTAAEIRDGLKSVMDSNDKLLVIKTCGVGSWFGFNSKGSSWLKDNI
jgi:hypothetical protein